VITPAGDPSVRNDTIYRLAVNPADHPGEDIVFLLDDGVLRFEADGRASRTYRQVVQILSREAAESMGERTYTWEPGRERLTINWIRVVRPNGEVVSEGPSHEQESLAPVAVESPVYTSRRLRRLSLAGVEPGTLVDWSVTTETLQPLMPADFYAGWFVTTGSLVRRSRYIVDVPASVELRFVEHNLNFPRRVSTTGGRRVYLWATAEVPKAEREMFASDSNGVEMHIDIGGPITWTDVARWYAGLARDRYQLTPAIEARVAELVAGARTLDDSLRALHRWVAQDFRYVSLSLGIAGYQPHYPREVFENRFGDCKDKATLFIAVARRFGLRAYPVLLSLSGGIERRLATPTQFDHMIAAVERGGRYLYLDLTSELTPYGQLPPSEQGEFALVVHDDGRGEEVTLPQDPPAANRSESVIEGELLPDGSFVGSYTEVKRGSVQYGLRDAFSRVYSDDERQRLVRAIADNVIEGAEGDSLVAFDGRDLTAEPRVSLRVRGGRLTSSSGGSEILTLPMETFASQRVVTELEARRPRRYPIAMAAVAGPLEEIIMLRLRLPEGWRARLPAPVSANSVFGSYTAEYVQQGRELRVSRRLIGSRGTQPPEKIGVLVEWLRAIVRDDVRYLVLERQ
jgi:transglutaminase-like putative cysteine protease